MHFHIDVISLLFFEKRKKNILDVLESKQIERNGYYPSLFKFKKNAEYVNKYLEKVTLPELRTCYFPRP